jgi:excisionase family DNA binding protein
LALTATEAAALAGVSKSAILKAIKSGKISAEKDINGEWRIEPVELLRRYEAVGDIPQQSVRQSTPHSADSLQRENQLLREMLLTKDEVIKVQEDALEDLRRAMLLLTATQPQPRTWWQRLFSS